jgi:hypothetical protein
MHIASILKQFASQKAEFTATLPSSDTNDTRPCDQRNVYTRAQSELVSSPRPTRFENELTKEKTQFEKTEHMQTQTYEPIVCANVKPNDVKQCMQMKRNRRKCIGQFDAGP